MADHGAFERLASRLLAATQQGKVQWSETADEDMFRSTFKEAAVRIARIFDDQNPREDAYYKIFLLNKSGRIADESPAEGDGGDLERLFDEARRSARDSTSVIESILAELGR